jgi:hypothetical protein
VTVTVGETHWSTSLGEGDALGLKPDRCRVSWHAVRRAIVWAVEPSVAVVAAASAADRVADSRVSQA